MVFHGGTQHLPLVPFWFFFENVFFLECISNECIMAIKRFKYLRIVLLYLSKTRYCVQTSVKQITRETLKWNFIFCDFCIKKIFFSSSRRLISFKTLSFHLRRNYHHLWINISSILHFSLYEIFFKAKQTDIELLLDILGLIIDQFIFSLSNRFSR